MLRLECSPFPRRSFLHVRSDPVLSFPLSSWSEIKRERDILGKGLMQVNVCVHFRNFCTLNNYNAPIEKSSKGESPIKINYGQAGK